MDTPIAALPVQPPAQSSPPAAPASSPQAPSSAQAASSGASSAAHTHAAASGTDPAADAAGTFAGALAQQLTRGSAAGEPPGTAPEDKHGARERSDGGTPDAMVALIAGAPLVPPLTLPPTAPASATPSAVQPAMAGIGRDGKGREQPASGERGALLAAADNSPPSTAAAASAHEAGVPAAAADVLAAHTHAPAALSATNAAALPPPTHMPPPAPAWAPAPTPPAAASAHIAVPVHSPAWGDAVAQQVTFMVKEGEHTAQLRLNPPELGPLEVRVSVTTGTDSVANAQFASPHAAVREALQAALPQLRNALADSGITLANASVGHGFTQQDPRQPQSGASGSRERSGTNAPGDAAAGIARPAGVTIARRGLVDTFA